MNLKYTGKFKTFPQDNRTRQTFRGRPLTIHLNNHDRVWNQTLTFTRRTDKGEAYQIRMRYNDEAKRQRYAVSPVLGGGPFQADESPLVQTVNSHLSYVGADVKYWHNDSTWTWSVRAGGERRGSRLHHRIAGEPSFTGSGHWNQYRGFGALTLRKIFFGNVEMHAKLTGNVIRNEANLQAGIDQTLFYVSPEVGVDYDFFQKQHLHVTYSLNHSLPAFTNLYGGRWLSGYRRIMQGSQLFAVVPSNMVTLLYQFGNWQNDFVLNTTVVYTTSAKSYVPTSTITPTYHWSTYRLAQGRHAMIVGLGLDEFLDFLSSNLSFHYKFNSSTYTSYFNNTTNSLQSRGHHFSAALRTAFVGHFNLSIGGTYALSRTRNQTTHHLRAKHYVAGYATVHINIGENLKATIKDKYYSIQHAGHYNFLDARLQYQLIEDRLTLFLSATNLMDNNRFQTVYLGDYAKYKQRNKLNHRYVMIGAKVSFR